MLGASTLLVAFVVVVLGYAILNKGEDDPTDISIEGVATYSHQGGQHTSEVFGDVDYQITPPVGGEHNPIWQNCAVYTEPVRNETGVHSLEHGAIWITYSPDLPEEELATLVDLVEGHPYRMISPYPGLDSPIVITAWDRQLKVDDADDERILEFIQAYEQGPTTPERGAACSGGVSRTAAEIEANPVPPSELMDGASAGEDIQQGS